MKQYQPLYLKYRPQILEELVGQEFIKKTLSNAITYNKIVHAYLFCGPRGTGKTSCARILAKSLNCEKGMTISPCGECTSCSAIQNSNSLDVIEIDAASHRKVEDAEDLITRVNLGTYGSRYKIYIVDEVHMLTDHAFNALLKTIEEPPKNVIFILATTEDHKVIPTVISRCQRFDFKPVSFSLIEKRILELAKKENISIDESIAKFISKRSLGCLRDAVSLLDQISVLQEDNKKIDPKNVFEIFGSIDKGFLIKFISALVSFDKKNAINLGEELVTSGKDISEIIKSMLEVLIDLGKAKLDENYKNELSKEIGDELSLLDKVSENHIFKIIDSLQDAQSKLRFAFSQELQFMTEIISLLDEDILFPLADLRKRIEILEQNPGSKEVSRQGSKETSSSLSLQAEQSEARQSHSNLPETSKEIASPVISEPSYNDVKVQSSGLRSNLDSTWNKVVNLISSNPTKTLLTQSGSYLTVLSEDLIEISLSKDMFLPRLEKDEKKKEMILKAVKEVSGFEPRTIRFKVLPREEVKKQESTSSPTLQPSGSTAAGSGNDDDFTRAIKDLLGAKEIN